GGLPKAKRNGTTPLSPLRRPSCARTAARRRGRPRGRRRRCPPRARAARAGGEAVVRRGERARDELRRLRRVGRLAVEEPDDPAGAVGVVEREAALEARADDRHVLPALARAAG